MHMCAHCEEAAYNELAPPAFTINRSTVTKLLRFTLHMHSFIDVKIVKFTMNDGVSRCKSARTLYKPANIIGCR